MGFTPLLNDCLPPAIPTCEVCYQKFSLKKNYLRHMREKHTGAPGRKRPATSPDAVPPTSPQPTSPPSPQPGTSSSPQPGPSDCSGKKGNCTIDSLRLYIAIVKIYIIRLFACF